MFGPNPNGPRSVYCDRAISYSGLGVRSVGPVGDFLDHGLLVWKVLRSVDKSNEAVDFLCSVCAVLALLMAFAAFAQGLQV